MGGLLARLKPTVLAHRNLAVMSASNNTAKFEAYKQAWAVAEAHKGARAECWTLQKKGGCRC